MNKLSKVINNDIYLDFGFIVLSENEMFNIRGGGERPISRPREILDWDVQSQATSLAQSNEPPSLIDYLKQLLKNLRK